MQKLKLCYKIRKHLSLHFYNFSTNFYTFSKFTGLNWIEFMSFYVLNLGIMFSLTNRSSARRERTERGSPVLFRRGSTSAAWARWGKGKRSSRATSGCSESGRGGRGWLVRGEERRFRYGRWRRGRRRSSGLRCWGSWAPWWREESDSED